jgi:tripartite-type tricarboxylate transporter receptor subunit TctC
MKLPRRKFLHLAAGAAALPAVLATVELAGAQDWPARPVTMIQPNTAGGGTDVLGRIIAARLAEVLGRPVVIENLGAAGGMVGSSRVAKAAPDGYQFLFGGVGTHAVNQTLYKNPLYNAATDFAPVALVVEQPNVLVARKDLPASNLRDFIAYATSNQAKMQYGSPGVGTVNHLACALLNTAMGVNVAHIPYRGSGPALQDLIAGRIDYQCASLATAFPQIESGTVRAIAILTKQRTPILPNLASAHEQGLTDFDAGAWNGLFFPKGTPATIVQKLSDAANKTAETPHVQERLRELGTTVVASERRIARVLAKICRERDWEMGSGHQSGWRLSRLNYAHIP